tara:strand:- start:3835 stop:3963 length:129 start_codon:yes stop_codon:yes gene_type:complete
MKLPKKHDHRWPGLALTKIGWERDAQKAGREIEPLKFPFYLL